MNIGRQVKTAGARLMPVAGIWRCLALALGLMSTPALAQLDISDAYLRLPPPGHPVAAVFLTLSNSGAQARQLVGARAEMADRVEIHTHEHVDGMMRMRELAQLQVPAYSEIKLKPGGHHLMVFGLRAKLAPGDTFAVTLLLADGQELPGTAVAKRP